MLCGGGRIGSLPAGAPSIFGLNALIGIFGCKCIGDLRGPPG
jgi:hypothetical protein